MDQDNQLNLDRGQIENFFLNQNIEIDFGNFFIAVLLSLVLSLAVKHTYIKVGKALNDKNYFSDTFIPLAIITTLVITVIKFSLALSLGLVGALSIVRFRAAIKEPEELVYLFFIISIGLANGANQFLLSFVSTMIIISFLFLRDYFQTKKTKEFQLNSDSNIMSINILNNKNRNIEEVVKQLKKYMKYLKLKSANIEKDRSTYIFWFDLDEKQQSNFLNNIKNMCDENLELSIYSKTGAFE